ncbi:MAG: RidA family protein [Spirochaetota bacterium]|nr:RidA family protein [Spirochaetota bacterium]
MKKQISTTKAPQAIGPYSQAIVANGMLYVSGQIPVNPATGQVSSDISEQTKQSMENIKAILEEAGTNFSKVVRCGIFIKNMDDFVKINEVYGSYFTEPYPARATVEVSRLPKDVLVEIDAIVLL